MTETRSKTAVSNDLADKVELTRRRAERSDGTIDLPFNEALVEVECPECGESFLCSIACSDPADYSPTFGTCAASPGCDAFLRFRHDGEDVDEPLGGQETLTTWGGA